MTAHTPIAAAPIVAADTDAADPAGTGRTRLHHALADELLNASRLLADLAYELGADPDTLRKHMTSLQAIDHITQIQLNVADLLRQHTPNPNTITLHDMAQRITLAIQL
jgi:hypothetical protein